MGINSLDLAIGTPLREIVSSKLELSDDERSFVNTKSSHVDFLIYDLVSKLPKFAIEVDGVAFHKEGSYQSSRDELKNEIFKKCDIPLLRFKTNGSGEREILRNTLKKYV